MKVIDNINTALSTGLAKAVFDHARNFLVCAFILAIGVQEMKPGTDTIMSFLSHKYSGVGIVALGSCLIVLNLLDGIRRIYRFKHHSLLIVGLIAIYILVSLRVIEVALSFRVGFIPS